MLSYSGIPLGISDHSCIDRKAVCSCSFNSLCSFCSSCTHVENVFSSSIDILTGIALRNMPIMFSTPSRSAGLPETSMPNTTSFSPAYLPINIPHAPSINVFSVTLHFLDIVFSLSLFSGLIVRLLSLNCILCVLACDVDFAAGNGVLLCIPFK